MSVMDVNASNQTLASRHSKRCDGHDQHFEVDIASMSIDQTATSAGDASNVTAEVDMSGQMIENQRGGIQSFRLNPTEESVGAMAQLEFSRIGLSVRHRWFCFLRPSKPEKKSISSSHGKGNGSLVHS